jgi:hypothetical protein
MLHAGFFLARLDAETQLRHEVEHLMVIGEHFSFNDLQCMTAGSFNKLLHQQVRDALSLPVISNHDSEFATLAIRVANITCNTDLSLLSIHIHHSDQCHLPAVVDGELIIIS